MSYPYWCWGPTCQLEPFFTRWNRRNNWCWHVRLVISERVLARWWHLEAIRTALGLLHHAMCAVSYCCIAMANKTTSKVGTFCIVVLLIVALAAARAIRREYSPNSGVRWLPVKPWSCWKGRCAPYCSNAYAWPLKWPVVEVHLFVTITFFDCCNHSLRPCYGPLQ